MKFENMPYGLSLMEQINFTSDSFESEFCPKCNYQYETFYHYFSDLPQYGYLRPVHPLVGWCWNRECGYKYTPKEHFADEYYLQLLTASMKGYEANHFISFLNKHFGSDIANRQVSMYRIGTSKLIEGATVFWPLDATGKVRGGKIMVYSPTTGKRMKELPKRMRWVHESVSCPHINSQQCFFGEHLLKGNSKPVAIVENEHTAIIASAYMPEYLWLAAGSVDGLTTEKCKVLKGRTVIMWPKLGAYDLWNEKAQELSMIATVTVSDYLERIATQQERKAGLDIADYLLKSNPPDPPQSTPPPTPSRPPEPPKASTPPKPYVKPQPAIQPHWQQDIAELETYFAGITLPTEPIRLTAGVTITDLPKFIDSHLNTLKANNGNPTFIATLKRIEQVYSIIAV
jgi:hypothetical protein